MRSESVRLISFSGIDGAGKSTQIEATHQCLQRLGLRTRVYTFWDDVVVLPALRERMSFSVFRGDRGVGRPDRPIVRRDKNVTSGYVIAFRLLLYFLDALRLCIVSSKSADAESDVVIFDRYIYDELANLPLKHRAVRLYIRLLLRLVPKPDLAFLLDADPEAACLRKPEYPLEFVGHNRDAYLNLARIAGMTVLPPQPINETTATIENSLLAVCFGRQSEVSALPVKPSAAPTPQKTTVS